MSKKNLYELKDLAVAFGPVTLLIVAIVFLAYKYVDPAPPRHVVITTGDEGGNYHTYALRYKELIKQEGIDLEVRPSKGAWDNLHQLEDPKGDVSAGFVQDGLGKKKDYPDISSLGSLYYEPVWIFYRGKTEITRFVHLKGKKIGMGVKGGEAHTMAKKLLDASGVDEKNSTLVEQSTQSNFESLSSGAIDAAFFVADPTDPLVAKMIRNPELHLMSLDQAEGITRQFRFLHHLTLPHGALDLKDNIPAHDVEMVAPTATLVVRNSIHPAVVYLLLKAASKVHHQPGIFEAKNEFPIDKDFIFPLNSGAKDFFKSGAPFWLRYLPFWLATIMERLLYIVLPMVALVLPMIKSIPKYLDWRIKNRIFQRYAELRDLENQIAPDSAVAKYELFLDQLDLIEERVNKMRLPVAVSDDVYLLREHIHFVREHLNRLVKKAKAGSRPLEA